MKAALLFTAVLMIVTQDGAFAVKPGSCPRLFDIPIPPPQCSGTLCSTDDDCSGELKCCLSDCNKTVCMDFPPASRELNFYGCSVGCIRLYQPVCGIDGVTYGNQCELETTACLHKQSWLTKAHNGPCPSA